MIKTKSIYDAVEEEDGQRILVSRFWPPGISRDRLRIGEWMREVAPSPELLEDWKEGQIKWGEYCRRYREEMGSRQDEIARLAKKARDKTITLLCFEPAHDPHCHRHILKKMIEKKPAEEN